MTDAAPQHKGLYSALAAAQAEMGRALKDTNNPHFGKMYADLASVMDACLPALNRHGIAVIQPTFDEDGVRYVKTILVHGPTGETTECRVPLIVGKQDMQGYGSAVTYARRYGLMGMAGVAPEDDDGNAAAKNPPKAGEDQPRQMPPAQNADAHETAVTFAVKRAATAADLDALSVRWCELSDAMTREERVREAFKSRKAELTAQKEQAA